MLLLKQGLGWGVLDAFKLYADDLLHKIIQYGGAIGGLAVTFAGGHSLVIALVAGVGLFYQRAVFLPVTPPGGSQREFRPTVAAVHIPYQKGLPPGGKRDLAVVFRLLPAVCGALPQNLLRPHEQVRVDQPQFRQDHLGLALPML